MMQIILLTTRNYLWLGLISAAIALPMTYYFMSSWLNVFSYSNGLPVVPFFISAIIIILTVIFYSAKAALAKTTDNLRSE